MVGTLRDLIATYPYLIAVFLAFGALLVVAANDPRTRIAIFQAGLTALPSAFSSALFVPDYWQPVRLVTLFETGIEDLLFAFSWGAWAWWLAVGPLRSRLRRADARHWWRRWLFLNVVGLGLLMVLYYAGVQVMMAALLMIVAVGLLVLWHRPRVWPLAASGALVTTPIYALFALGTLTLWPSFGEQWNHPDLWGLYLWRLPLEELAWATAFGAVWPLVVAYVFGVTLGGRHPARR